jgi:hypothetical protein
MKVDFLIAEEVRPEANNKISVLGLFAGDTVIMIKGERPQGVPEDTPAGLERLSILSIISDAPDGLHKFKGRLIEPSGELYRPESALGEATTKKGFSHTVIVELKPLIVKKSGIFRFEFFVDEEMFSYPFEIREQTQPAG